MIDALAELARAFAARAPAAEFWSLRLVDQWDETLSVRQGIPVPPRAAASRGALVTVVDADGVGYAATGDLSVAGLIEAVRCARGWAEATAGRQVVPARLIPRPDTQGRYETPCAEPWEGLAPGEKLALLQGACAALKVHDAIVDWEAWLSYRRTDVLLTSSAGAWIEQRFHDTEPGLAAVAHRGALTQRRTGCAARGGRRGGLEQLGPLGFPADAARVGEEAVALLDARPCPAGTMDLVLLPGQMALQVHESIGHPLELDRILGDERNYAGTSFVTPEMFGSFRYGSDLLNVTFDPGVPGELAGYGFDDEGTPAERVHLIRDGILERPLGGALSQARAGLPGTANARASDWYRPPIDRMANLNLEPGDSDLAELIGAVERGVLMDSNRSWSIDDSRNKFQFGCEIGWLIEDGELGAMVRTPNYRGVSSLFWRSLDGVGDAGTLNVEGVNSCGKGEPNQLVQVGHAVPACLFRGVDVFGEGD